MSGEGRREEARRQFGKSTGLTAVLIPAVLPMHSVTLESPSPLLSHRFFICETGFNPPGSTRATLQDPRRNDTSHLGDTDPTSLSSVNLR